MKKNYIILLLTLFSACLFSQSAQETEKKYDMLLATIANPKAKIGDFISNGYTVDNTQLLSKNEYKTKRVIIAKFTLSNGSFDEVSFSKTYEEAVTNYKQLANPDLDIKYSPFDTSRPRNSKVWDSSVKYYENKK